MKVKFGLGANVLAIKKRNLSDISTFIDQETEVGNPLLNQQAEFQIKHKTVTPERDFFNSLLLQYIW